MLRVWIRTLDRRSGLAMPAPRTRSISALSTYSSCRRLDCVDYAFCDLFLRVEYAG